MLGAVSDHLEMLRSFRPFVELCEIFDISSEHEAALIGYMKARGEWLRKDPFYLTHTFELAWRPPGLPSHAPPQHRPPTWVMDLLLSALQKRCAGEKSLDELLGFSGPGKHAAESAERRQALLVQFVNVARLMGFGLNTVEAARLVVCRDNEQVYRGNDVESANRIESMTGTLVKNYQRYPGRKKLREYVQLSLKKAKLRTDAEKNALADRQAEAYREQLAKAGDPNVDAKVEQVRKDTKAMLQDYRDFVASFPRPEVMRTSLRKFLSSVS